MLPADTLTLGLLAGGRASRLGGRDKAWLQRGGVPQVLWIARRFAGECGAVLVSANGDPARYADAGLSVVADRVPDIGPLGGLDVFAIDQHQMHQLGRQGKRLDDLRDGRAFGHRQMHFIAWPHRSRQVIPE